MPEQKMQHGYLMLADISGYTSYLAGVELDHAHEILSDLLETIVGSLKPLLTILTLPLIILTLGFFYLLINIAMIALAEWIAPNFSINGFWTYVGTVLVVWAVNWIGDQVLGDMQRRVRPRLI